MPVRFGRPCGQAALAWPAAPCRGRGQALLVVHAGLPPGPDGKPRVSAEAGPINALTVGRRPGLGFGLLGSARHWPNGGRSRAEHRDSGSTATWAVPRGSPPSQARPRTGPAASRRGAAPSVSLARPAPPNLTLSLMVARGGWSFGAVTAYSSPWQQTALATVPDCQHFHCLGTGVSRAAILGGA